MHTIRRDHPMEHTGYLGNARVVLNHYDVSTQADIQHVALSYESEDEIMARMQQNRASHFSHHNHHSSSNSSGSSSRSKRNTAHYSKQDIREQYCISDRGLGALENEREQSLFGCLSTHQYSSSCAQRASFLTACVRQKAPSDENLYELHRRHPAEYAPYPRRSRYPWAPLAPEIYRYDEDLMTSYFRRKVHHSTDPNRYTWMPSDDESVRMEKPRSILDPGSSSSASSSSYHHQQHSSNQIAAGGGGGGGGAGVASSATSPPVAPHSKKHVSFARSHTMASFDDAVSTLSSSSSQLNRMTRSQERLLDVRKTEGLPITRQPEPSDNLLIIDKVKRAPMKTQATQTEACLGRKPLPPGNINLSPRTIHRVKMVSQGAQTNGILINGRKLIKSYSEAGSKFGKSSPYHNNNTTMNNNNNNDEFPFDSVLSDLHEPLQRTQSDEPPRSPFMVTSPSLPLQLSMPSPPTPHTQAQNMSEQVAPNLATTSSSSPSHTDDHESEDSESKKEIFIDFKPQVSPVQGKLSKRPLTKAVSDGEILQEQRKTQKIESCATVSGDKQQLAISSFSHENIAMSQEEDQQPQRKFRPYFQKSPIRNEGICSKPLVEDHVYSSLSFDENDPNHLNMQDYIDEEFHENLIYNRMLMNTIPRQDSVENDVSLRVNNSASEAAASYSSPNDECVVPSVSFLSDNRKLSPFASNDSLANDIRDHSDGIWNESQATVLQVDSGTDNGTALSSSEMTSPGSGILLTPSSRRRHLLMMQHQQRSSMDTEALDEEFVEQIETSPRIVIDKPNSNNNNNSNRTYDPPPPLQPSYSNTNINNNNNSSSNKTGQQQQQYLTPQKQKRSTSPTHSGTWRRSHNKQHHHHHQRGGSSTPTEVPSRESPLPAAVVPDLLPLARTDSYRTNTDISESTTTTTTEDYVTANSGTDSSKRSGSVKGVDMYNLHHAQLQDGSSFESNKGDIFMDDMVVPSFSPPRSILEETPVRTSRSLSNTPVPEVRRRMSAAGRSSPSDADTSSSCGSYSVDGSCPDLLGSRSSINTNNNNKVPSSSASSTPHHHKHHKHHHHHHKNNNSNSKKSLVASEDDDSRTLRYSSPMGYCESPIEDSWQNEELVRDPKPTTNKHSKRRPYTLEIGDREDEHQEPQYTIISPSSESSNKPTKSTNKKSSNELGSSKLSPSSESSLKVVSDSSSKSSKRSKTRTRSPMQQQSSSHRKHHQIKKSSSSSRADLIQSSDERYMSMDDPSKTATSDESSCDFSLGGRYTPTNQQQTSPRKTKKIKENSRRKSLPRSPITTTINNNNTVSGNHQQRTTSGSSKRDSFEDKSSSLPGSLNRRRSSTSGNSRALQAEDAKSTLGLYSPVGSPGKKRHSPQRSPENFKLKALSAESLRSVSPGSDSVFYSDPSSHTVTDHQVHCLHCGKEVDIITTDDPDKSPSSNNNHGGGGSSLHPQQDIVQPPAGFEDSPRSRHPAGITTTTISGACASAFASTSGGVSGRLYKKLDRRFRSEDRTQMDLKKNRFKPDVRAKSEERDAKTFRGKLRPMAKSTNNSQEQLKATDSSPSVLPGAPEDEDDVGIYDVPFSEGYWIYIDERDHIPIAGYESFSIPDHQETTRRSSVSSTESEQEFHKRYQFITHRMVHRKSCLEMYKRQNMKSFVNGVSDETTTDENNVRTKLEEILKLMLVIWCRQNQALKLTSPKPNEVDKTVVIRRGSGEFGFRIHGSKPVVISAIEPNTPAETSGLEVGDIVVAVNGVSVLDRTHSEVVKIAHAGSDTLTLEVVRTCYAFSATSSHQDGRSTKHGQGDGASSSAALYSGYLWKLSGYASGNTTNKWIRRWFCLKRNNCLYYYKTDSDIQPVGVVFLFEHEIRKQSDDEEGYSKPFRFVLEKTDSVPLHLAADSQNAVNRWVEVIGKAINDTQAVDEFLEQTKKYSDTSPSQIPHPDCFGYLVKLGTQWKSWSKRYCVLKDACLYFFQDAISKNAFGIAFLQGYRVQTSSCTKKHAFEIIPPDPDKKHYYFHTESDADKKRWIAALEYSIDRWLKVQ